MIFIYSVFNVADNTGVNKVFGIQNISKKSKQCGIGDIIIGIVKSSKFNSKFKSSSIVWGIIIRLNTFIDNLNFKLKFKDNSIILIDTKLNILGTKIFGTVPFILTKKYKKLFQLTKNII